MLATKYLHILLDFLISYLYTTNIEPLTSPGQFFKYITLKQLPVMKIIKYYIYSYKKGVLWFIFSKNLK